METEKEVLPIKPGLTLDIIETNAPALSATSDMPVIETRPDSLPPEKVKEPEKVPAVPPKAKEPEGEAEPLEESATSTTEKPGQPTQDKTPRGVGKKIAELTKARSEAEARALKAEENLANALKLQEKIQPVEEEPVRPSRNDFTDPDSYDSALLEYAEEKAVFTAKKQVKEMLAEQQESARQKSIEEGQRVVRDAYSARLDKAREKYVDFEDVAQTPDVQVSMPMAHVIMTSEQGPDIQYYLGKNPDEAQRILSYVTPDGVPDVARQFMELGLIVGKLNPSPTISKASPPIKPLKPAPTGGEKDPSEMSMDEYKAWRKRS